MNIQEFTNSKFGTLTTITTENNEILFVAKEIANILEYSDTHWALKLLDDDEKLNLQIASPGMQRRKTSIITKSGLYHLIFKSTKPQAKVFRKWITSEVLPQIEQTGAYLPNDLNSVLDILFAKVQQKRNDLIKQKTEIDAELNLLDKEYLRVLKGKMTLESAIKYFYPPAKTNKNKILLNASELLDDMHKNSDFPNDLLNSVTVILIGKILNRNNYKRIPTNYKGQKQTYRYELSKAKELQTNLTYFELLD